jgi:hypothetical protein
MWLDAWTTIGLPDSVPPDCTFRCDTSPGGAAYHDTPLPRLRWFPVLRP